jgi:hypothetical protein
MDFHPLEIVFDIENPKSVFWNKILMGHEEKFYANIAYGLLYGFGKKSILFWIWQEEMESRGGKAITSFLAATPAIFLQRLFPSASDGTF